VLHQQAISLPHLTANMVCNALDTVHQLIESLLPKARTEFSLPKQYFTTTLMKQTLQTPLMAQPVEVINVTGETSSGSQGGNKPPD
jgi:hypothetical protein